MTASRSQSTYQLRLAWGTAGLTTLADAGIVVVVDALDAPAASEAVTSVGARVAPGADVIGDAAADLAAQAAGLPHGPTVFRASLRNATATARAIVDEQLARGDRTAVNLVLAGDGGAFAVEDYLAAGALGDALSKLGLDHTAPDLAVAIEGFRPLTRALKHLLSASAAGLALTAAGRRDEVRAAAELDADSEARRVN
ncbi:2-phosphosulfolactate phosphatase [Leucobacter insecticola]|uniref:Probable 2-phosphosulfolactate phosphatase n=1 Tax=Leucobacter insecticola TaxID=2714934 RepID=A0A6G8FJ57_9MICO|nr:2-phosphosulfolactate phosphatase [Leucobacter insecticola]QIM16319.1 2-phosphosulfolactate phosphatase [Leucobacter insecticola]